MTKVKKKRPVQPEDLLAYRVLSRPRISPDGRQVVFVEKRVGDKNRYDTNLWLVGAEEGLPRQFTTGNRDSQPLWSPDGGLISFVRSPENAAAQLYVMPVDGGEARQLSKFQEGDIGRYIWSPSGDVLAVAFRERDPEWTKAAKQEREENGFSTPARVIDDPYYREDGDGYFNAQRYQLYLVDAHTGEHRLFYAKDTLGRFDFDFCPDGTELVIATNRDKKALFRPWKAELIRVRVSDRKIQPLRQLPAGPKCSVCWSRDGKTIVYAGREGEDGEYSTENLELWACDADGSHPRCLSSRDDYCLLAVPIADATEAAFEPTIAIHPNSSLVYCTIGHHGQVHVANSSINGGGLQLHSCEWPDLEMGNFSADGKRLALTVGSPTSLAEVAVAACGRGRFTVTQRTSLNADLLNELDLVTPESHWIEAEDGHQVQVWLLKPTHAKRSRPVAGVLEIHGGPHAQYGSGYFHEFQMLASAGYAVFYSNPRGSKGYGRDHCAAIRGKWGTADWLDVQAVTRFMGSRPFVDENRLGLMGGSYGGYMTNWAISHSQDFAAAITDRCVSNLVSMSGSSDFLIEPDRYFPGNFWDRPEKRWSQSPIAHFANVRTPTLVIHSEGDLRCNVEQGEQVYAALTLLEVPTRFIRYPSSTSHGMSRQGPPDLRLHRLKEILRWWREHLA